MASDRVARGPAQASIEASRSPDLSLDQAESGGVAEGEGFEPSSDRNGPKRFSRPPHSTTLPPLRDGEGGKASAAQPIRSALANALNDEGDSLELRDRHLGTGRNRWPPDAEPARDAERLDRSVRRRDEAGDRGGGVGRVGACRHRYRRRARLLLRGRPEGGFRPGRRRLPRHQEGAPRPLPPG